MSPEEWVALLCIPPLLALWIVGQRHLNTRSRVERDRDALAHAVGVLIQEEP